MDESSPGLAGLAHVQMMPQANVTLRAKKLVFLLAVATSKV
jgi:hypothetical protein